MANWVKKAVAKMNVYKTMEKSCKTTESNYNSIKNVLAIKSTEIIKLNDSLTSFKNKHANCSDLLEEKNKLSAEYNMLEIE